MGAPELKRVAFRHEQMIDFLVANPGVSQGNMAVQLGVTQSWLSTMMNSSAFQEALTSRKDALVDPIIRATLEDKLRALADVSLSKLLEKLHTQPDSATSLKALDLATRSLGMGRGPAVNVNVQTNYTAIVPAKSESSSAWAATYGSRAEPVVLAAETPPEVEKALTRDSLVPVYSQLDLFSSI